MKKINVGIGQLGYYIVAENPNNSKVFECLSEEECLNKVVELMKKYPNAEFKHCNGGLTFASHDKCDALIEKARTLC